jgi:hypothetical protein
LVRGKAGRGRPPSKLLDRILIGNIRLVFFLVTGFAAIARMAIFTFRVTGEDVVRFLSENWANTGRKHQNN